MADTPGPASDPDRRPFGNPQPTRGLRIHPTPYEASIFPVVDFNAEGKVDLVDLVMLIQNWGTNKTLCDIGPMPWGDGKVDIEDLKVFMTYYEKENPPVKL